MKITEINQYKIAKKYKRLKSQSAPRPQIKQSADIFQLYKPMRIKTIGLIAGIATVFAASINHLGNTWYYGENGNSYEQLLDGVYIDSNGEKISTDNAQKVYELDKEIRKKEEEHAVLATKYNDLFDNLINTVAKKDVPDEFIKTYEEYKEAEKAYLPISKKIDKYRKKAEKFDAIVTAGSYVEKLPEYAADTIAIAEQKRDELMDKANKLYSEHDEERSRYIILYGNKLIYTLALLNTLDEEKLPQEYINATNALKNNAEELDRLKNKRQELLYKS